MSVALFAFSLAFPDDDLSLKFSFWKEDCFQFLFITKTVKGSKNNKRISNVMVKGSSPKSTCKIEQFLANLLNSIPPEIIIKCRFYDDLMVYRS